MRSVGASTGGEGWGVDEGSGGESGVDVAGASICAGGVVSAGVAVAWQATIKKEKRR